MAEHVTYWRMQVAPGKMDELRAHIGATPGEDRIRGAGWKGTVVGVRKDNPNEIWGCVTWDNSANYRKNAEDPAQNEWFQKTRSFLTADPEWFDCDVLEERRA